MLDDHGAKLYYLSDTDDSSAGAVDYERNMSSVIIRTCCQHRGRFIVYRHIFPQKVPNMINRSNHRGEMISFIDAAKRGRFHDKSA